MAYGTEQILSNNEYFIGIISVFYSGIRGNKFNTSAFYTCILIQTWLINCTKLSNDNLIELLRAIIRNINRIIQNYNNKESLEEEKYNYLGYVTLILCSLINYSSIIIPLLQKTKNEDSLKNWLILLINENEAGFEYEIKIIIYSICTIIKNGIINGDIQYLLNICVKLLKCQEDNAKFELKNKSGKKIGLKFVEDDDEEESEKDEKKDYEEELNDYLEIKELISKTINPIKDKDEFLMFKELLFFLKENRNNIYINWENSLDEKQKKDVYNLTGTKRINIQSNDKNKIQVPRRILTIKRGQNNNNNQ